MSEKEMVSFRVAPGKKDQLESDHFNVSSLMRDLLDGYLRAGDSVEVGLQRRLKDKESQLDDLRLERTRIDNDIQRVEREVETLEEKIKERRESAPEPVVEFAEKIRSGTFDTDQLDPENPATQTWASKAGLPPQRFITEVESRL